MKKIFTLLLIIILFTCTSLLGDTKIKLSKKVSEAKGKLAGKVTDNKGYPVPSVNIMVMDSKTLIASKKTNKNGSYLIINITPGVYDVICKHESFRIQKFTGVEIKPDLTTTLSLTMLQKTIETEGIKVVENKAEITRPATTGSGKTVTTPVVKDEPNVEIIANVEIIDEEELGTEEHDIEIIETIGATSLEPYEEVSTPTIEKRKSPSEKNPSTNSRTNCPFEL